MQSQQSHSDQLQIVAKAPHILPTKYYLCICIIYQYIKCTEWLTKLLVWNNQHLCQAKSHTAWASAQIDQTLHRLHEETLRSLLPNQCTANTQIRPYRMSRVFAGNTYILVLSNEAS